MWGLTIADLRYRYRQFLIAVVGAGVVLAMALLLAGLAHGFAVEIDQTVGAVGADRWVLNSNADGRMAAVGVFPQSDATLIAHSPGVTRADALVIAPQQVAHIGDSSKTINVFGVTPGGMGSPVATSGRGLTGPGEVVASTAAGTRIGSEIEIGTMNFKVTGVVRDRTMLGGGPIVYMTLQDAQALALGGRPLITAVVTQGVPAQVPAGLTALNVPAVEQNQLAALSNGVKSIDNSKVLMWVVAGIIIAALLYVSALQRVRDFAVLKALGSSSLLLFLGLALQAVIVALVAGLFAMVISNFMGGMFAQPVVIPISAFAMMPVVAVVVGLLSSLFAVRRIARSDPAAAFGG
jgi:putative ABC transport system permease protein